MYARAHERLCRDRSPFCPRPSDGKRHAVPAVSSTIRSVMDEPIRSKGEAQSATEPSSWPRGKRKQQRRDTGRKPHTQTFVEPDVPNSPKTFDANRARPFIVRSSKGTVCDVTDTPKTPSSETQAAARCATLSIFRRHALETFCNVPRSRKPRAQVTPLLATPKQGDNRCCSRSPEDTGMAESLKVCFTKPEGPQDHNRNSERNVHRPLPFPGNSLKHGAPRPPTLCNPTVRSRKWTERLPCTEAVCLNSQYLDESALQCHQRNVTSATQTRNARLYSPYLLETLELHPVFHRNTVLPTISSCPCDRRGRGLGCVERHL